MEKTNRQRKNQPAFRYTLLAPARRSLAEPDSAQTGIIVNSGFELWHVARQGMHARMKRAGT
jgi:hypothetical protein